MSWNCLPLLICAVLIAMPASAEEPGAEPSYGFNWIPPSGYYGDWVFLLLGFYSGLDGLGLGAEVSHPFRIPGLARYRVSEVEAIFKGRVYEDLHGEFQATGDATFGDARWSVRAHFLHSTRLREFWGIGPDLPDSDREQYRPRNLRTYVELFRNIARFRAGLRVEFQDYQYLEREPGGLLENGDYDGVTATGENVGGVGLTMEYDSRDDRYTPTTGWRVSSSLMAFDAFRSGEDGFVNAFLDVRNYRSTSPRNVFALQYFLFGVNGRAPIWRYAVIGGREHTRGYSRNRYVDQKMMAVQVEWRRHLHRRLGLQVFTGSALVTPEWAKMQLRHHRPTFGAGLSLVIPQVSSIAIRGDLAVGDESLHGRIAIGLAF